MYMDRTLFVIPFWKAIIGGRVNIQYYGTYI